MMEDIFAFLHEHFAENNHTPNGEAVVGAEDHAVEDSSSGAAQIIEKQEKLKEERKRAHAEHKAQHFTKGMFRDSAIVKTKVLLPIFAGSLVISGVFPEAFDALSVVFVGLGTYISYEAVTSARKLLGKAHKSSARVKAAKNPNQSPIEAFVDYRKKIDIKTSGEVAIGLISSIHTLGIEQQMIIMGLCGVVMTAGPPVMTNILIVVEEKGQLWAQKARDLKSDNFFKRFLVKRNLHNRLGDFVEDSTTRLFNIMPWMGVAVKGVAGGRVFAHGIAPLENLFGECARSLLQKEMLWGATGFVVGVGTDAVYHKAIKPVTKEWPAAARAMLVTLSLSGHPGKRTKPQYKAHYEIKRPITLSASPSRPLSGYRSQMGRHQPLVVPPHTSL
ncbi:MAG: hypothetical protein WCD70_04775 [Alphaproteobacteria bacterium]